MQHTRPGCVQKGWAQSSRLSCGYSDLDRATYTRVFPKSCLLTFPVSIFFFPLCSHLQQRDPGPSAGPAAAAPGPGPGRWHEGRPGGCCRVSMMWTCVWQGHPGHGFVLQWGVLPLGPTFGLSDLAVPCPCVASSKPERSPSQPVITSNYSRMPEAITVDLNTEQQARLESV